jgi:hypothetical protein
MRHRWSLPGLAVSSLTDATGYLIPRRCPAGEQLEALLTNPTALNFRALPRMVNASRGAGRLDRPPV